MSDDKYNGEERRQPRRWRFNKELSLTDLALVLSALAAAVYAYTTVDKRVSIVETATASQVGVDKRQDDDTIRYQMRIETQLNEMNRKLDRLVERNR